MGKLFNEEKVLYFASQSQGLHVSIQEGRDTDLSRYVRHFIGNKWIEKVAEDDSGTYFQITESGEAHLLELQIKWRTQHGKSVDAHKARLAELKGEAA